MIYISLILFMIPTFDQQILDLIVLSMNAQIIEVKLKYFTLSG